MTSLEGKVVILAGGAGAIGLAAAQRLGQAGARLLLADCGAPVDGRGADPRVAEAAAAKLAAAGIAAHPFAEDLTQPGAAERAVQAALERFGAVDHLIYGAGIQRDLSALSGSPEDLEATVRVGVFGAFRTLQAVAKQQVAQKRGGAIVLLGAPGALHGLHKHADLATATGALVGLVRTAALELRRHHIRVNLVLPTARSRTNESLPLFQSVRAASLLPEHVAPLLSHLLTDAGAAITGEVIGAAGGRVYALHTKETPGVTGTPPLSEEALQDEWDVVIRPGPAG